MSTQNPISLLGQLIGLVQSGHTRNDRHHTDRRRFEDAVISLLMQFNQKVDKMSQELRDAVAAVAANVQTLTDNTAAHDTEVQAGIAALKDALAKAGAGTDPDVAAAVAQLSTLSTSVKTAADTINTETQAIAAAMIAPPPAASDPTANPSTTGAVS
jgi:methyl-accepting chemotaxis protein